MTKAERFARLNGIEPEVLGGKYLKREYYPKFEDAKSILEVMKGRSNFGNFLCQVGRVDPTGEPTQYGTIIYEAKAYLEIDYILNPDKLLEEAIKWCEKRSIK